MTVLFNPNALERGLRATFLAQYAMEDPYSLMDLIATVVGSDAYHEKYLWLGESPQMELITDEFKAAPLSDTTYTIENKKFGAMIEVKRDDIMDEQFGAMVMRIRQMAMVAKRHPNALIANAIVANPTCYDGVSFFHASHPNRNKSGVQSNLVSTTGVTTAQVAADFNSAITKMMNQLSENGEPFNEGAQSFVALMPWSYRKSAREALNAAIISQTSNVQFLGDQIKLVFTARLSSTPWYLFANDGPVRPIIFQDREPLTFEALEANSGSDMVFRREVYAYKARARRNIGVSFWQKAIKVA